MSSLPATQPEPQSGKIHLLPLATSGARQGYAGSYTPEQFIAMHPHLGIPAIPEDVQKLPILTCEVELAPGVKLKAWARGNYVFIGAVVGHLGNQIQTWNQKVEEVAPFMSEPQRAVRKVTLPV